MVNKKNTFLFCYVHWFKTISKVSRNNNQWSKHAALEKNFWLNFVHESGGDFLICSYTFLNALLLRVRWFFLSYIEPPSG